MIEIIEKKLLYITKTIGLIILLLTFAYIPLIIFKIDYTKISQLNKIIYLTIMDSLLIIILILIYRKDIKDNFKNFFNKNIINNLKTPIKYWLLGLLIMITSNIIINIMTNIEISQNEQAVRELVDKAPLFMIFQSLIYAPITEELIFRKSIKDIVSNKYLYAIISGLVFGSMHILLSINNLKELLFIIPYSAVGFTFALCYYKTNNIFSTITAHSIHNTLTLILYFLI